MARRIGQNRQDERNSEAPARQALTQPDNVTNDRVVVYLHMHRCHKRKNGLAGYRRHAEVARSTFHL